MAIHATIEEKLFYRAANGPETEDVLRESVEEHLSVKRLIADLMDSETSDPQFDAKILVAVGCAARRNHEESHARLDAAAFATCSALPAPAG